ncbi:MAG: hypothetical protein WBD20_16085 [Pirellulaceae bacterium]
MTQSPPTNIVAAILALGTAFLLSTEALAQQTELPPTLRAAHAVNQQSTGVIDQLLQSADHRATQSANYRATQSANHRATQSAVQPTADSSLASNGLRTAADQLRPAPSQPRQREFSNSIDPAYYAREQLQASATPQPSTNPSSDEAWDRILRSSSAGGNHDSGVVPVSAETDARFGESFIEQEKADPTKQDQSTAALIKKISINLMFVLAFAFGVLMLIKQLQKGRGVGKKKMVANSALEDLNVSQVLPLTNGASLHVVEGNQNKFLVAIDASGIKSVNILGASNVQIASFDDTMRQVETRQQRRETKQKDEPTTYKFVDPNEDSTEIDEKLIKMLLQRSSSVA